MSGRRSGGLTPLAVHFQQAATPGEPPIMVDQESTYTDPAVRAAIREATGAAPVAPTGDLTDRSNWLDEVTRRIEATPPHASGRYVSIGVAAAVAVRFAADVTEAVGSEPTDRIGDHYRVTGWIDGDDSQDDYCGFCSIDGSPGAPAQRFAWPCDLARKAVGSDPGVLATLRADIAGLHTTLTAATNSCTRLEGENDGLRLQVGLRDAKIKVLEEAGRLTAEGREQDAVSYRVQLAQIRDHRDELSDKVDELEAVIAHRMSMHTGLIDPTPGQITAYLKAAREAAPDAVDPEPFPWAAPSVIRAGLGAVQWALLNPTTDGEGVATRDRRPGDRVTLTGILGDFTEDSYGLQAYGRTEWLNDITYTVTRPAAPLPTEPGYVVEATVRGRTVKLVLTDDPDPQYRWFIITGVNMPAGEARWVRSDELTAVRVLSTPDNAAGDTP